ncbi:MAG TPA: cytochrome c [Terriglobia bacterium]|nr:cytochrome c [Terriglobia bacterium]
MNRSTVRFILPVLALLAVVTAAYAGGWAIITLNDMPDYAVAGKPLNLTFTVRQHGVTLLSGLQPSVRATQAGGLVAKAAVVRTAKSGEYTTAVTLPQPGEWTITINSGFNSSATTLPVLKVISQESPVPAPFSPNTRGARLFAAKGCVGCHRHGEINPERTADAKFDLTTKRFPPDYLKKFLADPSIKPADMPKLNLKEDEIEALAAFINKSTLKTSQARTNQ